MDACCEICDCLKADDVVCLEFSFVMCVCVCMCECMHVCYMINTHTHIFYIYIKLLFYIYIYIYISGVVLIAKFCINIVFLGCCMHFSHITASAMIRVHKMTIPIKQVMPHWWMPHHSTLDLLANSVSSQLFKSSQWRAESGQWNKCVTSCKIP